MPAAMAARPSSRVGLVSTTTPRSASDRSPDVTNWRSSTDTAFPREAATSPSIGAPSNDAAMAASSSTGYRSAMTQARPAPMRAPSTMPRMPARTAAPISDASSIRGPSVNCTPEP
jgi:hypothetical protein